MLLMDDAEVPASISQVLGQFVECPDSEHLRAVQVATAGSGLWSVGPECFATLVAHLGAAGHLSLRESAAALAAIPIVERRSLRQITRHAIDVAEAVAEDAKDGVMQIDDDDVLREVLRRLSAEG
jgi:hypothetical protein